MNKKEFVKNIGVTIVAVNSNVEKIEYKTFQHKHHNTWKKEYLIITYKGEAFTARNCTSNSYSAILQEIARYVDCGYYDECEAFTRILTNPEWKEEE